jgi:hypothetical protein
MQQREKTAAWPEAGHVQPVQEKGLPPEKTVVATAARALPLDEDKAHRPPHAGAGNLPDARHRAAHPSVTIGRALVRPGTGAASRNTRRPEGGLSSPLKMKPSTCRARLRSGPLDQTARCGAPPRPQEAVHPVSDDRQSDRAERRCVHHDVVVAPPRLVEKFAQPWRLENLIRVWWRLAGRDTDRLNGGRAALRAQGEPGVGPH